MISVVYDISDISLLVSCIKSLSCPVSLRMLLALCIFSRNSIHIFLSYRKNHYFESPLLCLILSYISITMVLYCGVNIVHMNLMYNVLRISFIKLLLNTIVPLLNC